MAGLSNRDCRPTAKMLLAVLFTYWLDAFGMTNRSQTTRNSRFAVDECRIGVYIYVHLIGVISFCEIVLF